MTSLYWDGPLVFICAPEAVSCLWHMAISNEYRSFHIGHQSYHSSNTFTPRKLESTCVVWLGQHFYRFLVFSSDVDVIRVLWQHYRIWPWLLCIYSGGCVLTLADKLVIMWNFDFEVKFDLEGQGHLTHKTTGILTKVFCPNLVDWIGFV